MKLRGISAEYFQETTERIGETLNVMIKFVFPLGAEKFTLDSKSKFFSAQRKNKCNHHIYYGATQ